MITIVHKLYIPDYLLFRLTGNKMAEKYVFSSCLIKLVAGRVL